MKIPLVLLPGLLSNATLWQGQLPALSSVSDPQILIAPEDTPDQMVQGLLDKAPPTFALAGHSMGGWLSLEIMKRAPERVAKLALLNTTARPDSMEKRKRRLKMIEEASQGRFPGVVKSLAEAFVLSPSLRGDVEKMFYEVGSRAFINQERAMLLRGDCLSILPSIRCPTLVVHALNDRVFTLEEHLELSDSMKNATLSCVENSGHMSPLENPEAVTSLLLRWLKS